MKRLILILLFPLSLMAQDTIRFVGSKANGSASGEWKFLIIGQAVSAISGNDTIPFPSGGSPDSSIFATVYQLGLKANLGEMNTALSGKAATSHGHAQSEITDLVTALSGKAASSHGHAQSEITNLVTDLGGKAATSHGHAISEVTDLQTSLDAKLATTAVKQGTYLSDTTKFPLVTSLRQGAYLSDTTKFSLTTALRQGAYLSDTTKFPLTSALKQGAYLSDTTKFAPTSHTQAQSTVTGLTDSVAAKPTRPELTTLLGTKQATISNLADTSKYYEKIQAGIVPTAELGSGSATSSTYLRGDQTWATPSGSGLPNYVSVKRTADTSTSLATPLNINGMTFSVTSGTYYAYRYVLLYQTAATTTGIKLSLTFPTVTTQSARVTISGQTTDGATTEPWCGTINSSGDVVTSTGVAVVNVNYVAIVEGTILPSASGYLRLLWSSETTAAATLKQGSIGYIWSF